MVVIGALMFKAPLALWQPVFPHFSDIDKRLSQIDIHLASIDGSLKVIIPRMARQDLKDAVTSANSKDAVNALSFLESAKDLLADAKPLKIPARPQFFDGAVGYLDDLDNSPVTNQIAGDIHAARIALAEYRSAIEPIPTISGLTRFLNSPVGPPYKLICQANRIIWTGTSTSDMFKIMAAPRHVY